MALDEHFDEFFGLELRESGRLGADGEDQSGNGSASAMIARRS
jgi:hypothetical protein